MNKEQIIHEIQSLLIANEKIKAVFIYGSFLNSEHFNDIDIAVFFYDKLENYFDIESELEFYLQKKIQKKIDLRIVNNAPYSFLYEVFKGRCLIDKDDEIGDLIEKVIIKEMDEEYYKRQILKDLICD